MTRNPQPTTHLPADLSAVALAKADNPQPNLGFTLIELLIVVSVIVILAGVILMANIKSSLQKARDSKRKQDLNKLTRLLEDYYNDQGRYPVGNIDNGTIADAPWGSPFSSYVPLLPKDPFSPAREYYYQTGPTLQNFFAIYAKLENTADPDIERVGCSSGCGPYRAYNYVVHSPNIVMLAGIPSMDTTTPGSGTGIGADGIAMGGGGGEGTPSSTPGPTSIPVPLPTATPFVPPTSSPNAQCDYGECCKASWCGGGPGVGVYCVTNERCWYDPIFGWACYFAPQCP